MPSQSIFKAGFLKTPHFSRRPEPPYALNLDCMQADRLQFFLPIGDVYEVTLQPIDRKTAEPTVSGATLVADQDGGRVRSFNGSNQYLEWSAVPAGAGSAMTFSCWFRSNSSTVDQGLISVSNIANPDGDVHFYGLQASGNRTNDPVSVRMWAGAGEIFADSDTGYTVDKWHHAVGWYNGGTDRRGGIDGILGASETTSAFPTSLDRTGIGRITKLTPQYYFNGNIAHVCIWNRTLSFAEVWQLYDPSTRWDLYYPLRRRIFSFPSQEAAAIFSFPMRRHPMRHLLIR